MNTVIDSTLSAELQELYLENKEWFSDVLFLEDDMRFFQHLLDQVFMGNGARKDFQHIEIISVNLNLILERRKRLKHILTERTHQLEALLKNTFVRIGLEIVEEDASIIKEIKYLMKAEKSLKEQLFTLIILQKENIPVRKSNHLKVPRYRLL